MLSNQMSPAFDYRLLLPAGKAFKPVVEHCWIRNRYVSGVFTTQVHSTC